MGLSPAGENIRSVEPGDFFILCTSQSIYLQVVNDGVITSFYTCLIHKTFHTYFEDFLSYQPKIALAFQMTVAALKPPE